MAANSLGRSEDIPERSLAALRVADLLVFEEDRAARQALKAAGLHRSYLRLTEHREAESLEAVEKALINGSTVVYMSDQGTPTVADPGRELLVLAYRLRAHVQVIPGPSSITAALAACSFLHNGFVFLGFLPREEEAREATLRAHAHSKLPLVLLDTPYRRDALLASVKKVLGAERLCLLAEDISGPNESFCEAAV